GQSAERESAAAEVGIHEVDTDGLLTQEHLSHTGAAHRFGLVHELVRATMPVESHHTTHNRSSRNLPSVGHRHFRLLVRAPSGAPINAWKSGESFAGGRGPPPEVRRSTLPLGGDD